MPKPITNEQRKKIIKHKQNGAKEADIAQWLFISKSAVSTIWGKFKKTNDYKLKYENCGRKSVIDSDLEFKIIAKIKKTPGVTILELIEKFDIKITESGLSKWLKRRGSAFKKDNLPNGIRPIRCPRNNKRNKNLVSLDESSINLTYIRLYGRGKKNKRVKEDVIDARFERKSVFSTIRLNGKVCPLFLMAHSINLCLRNT